MKFNDKMSEFQDFAAHNQEMSSYQRNSLKESDYQNRLPLSSKLIKRSSSNLTLLRGKQNQCRNPLSQNVKPIVTNHSFNEYFNENTQKLKRKVNESINKKIEFSKTLHQSSQVNCHSSNNNFYSSTKLSNFHFANQSESSSTLQIHDQVKSFIKKYFSDCQQLLNLAEQYVLIHDFVDILFEEFQNLIGKQSSVDLIEEFTDKVFLIFGENIYFGQLFEKTCQNGLTGLIFQIVKAINDDKSMNCEVQQKNSQIKGNLPLKQTITVSPKNISSSNINNFKSSNKNSQFFKNNNFENSKITHSTNEKISLNKFFGNSTSKVQFNEQSKVFFDQSTIYLDENLEEVKKILSDYVEGMYEQAETKLNKKYSQEMRKITLKHKETERLLEKINQKISNHYDSLQLQKQYDRKIKEMTEKQIDFQDKLKKLEFELKQSKDQTQKQKLNYTKLDQQFTKIKEKLEKYENAIFQKAMQKESSQNNSNSNSRINQNSSTNSSVYLHQQNTPLYVQKLHPQQQNSKFEVKIDTLPVITPLTHHHNPSYSPYLTRQADGSLTPTRLRQTKTRVSISPIKQRISFVKTANPSLSNNPKMTQIISENSRISYSPALYKVSNQTSKVQIGEKVSLRPLSPIGKLGETQQKLSVNNVSSSRLLSTQNNLSQIKYTTHHNNQNIAYSPIKVQFCLSQVDVSNVPNR